MVPDTLDEVPHELDDERPEGKGVEDEFSTKTWQSLVAESPAPAPVQESGGDREHKLHGEEKQCPKCLALFLTEESLKSHLCTLVNLDEDVPEILPEEQKYTLKLWVKDKPDMDIMPIIKEILMRQMTIWCDLTAPGIIDRIKRFQDRRWSFVFSPQSLLLRQQKKKRKGHKGMLADGSQALWTADEKLAELNVEEKRRKEKVEKDEEKKKKRLDRIATNKEKKVEDRIGIEQKKKDRVEKKALNEEQKIARAAERVVEQARKKQKRTEEKEAEKKRKKAEREREKLERQAAKQTAREQKKLEKLIEKEKKARQKETQKKVKPKNPRAKTQVASYLSIYL